MKPTSGPARRVAAAKRPVRSATYLLFFAAFAAVVFGSHAEYFRLAYFWDELGQFVPAALDILHDGAWVPHSAVPNVHPPGVMAYLAAVWKIFGYSIPATRAAMLALASLAALSAFLLAIELCRGVPGAPAFAAVALLLLDPLFYMQSMMAQLDMPAMLFTLIALLLFLQDRHMPAALACVTLVLAKETGALLPLVFGAALLLDSGRRKSAVYYAAPFVVLAAWLFVLRHATGTIFGDPGFAHYNIGYALNPVRAALCLVRRIYFLFVADLRWVGSIAIVLAWRSRRVYASRAWRITWIFLAAHVLLVSLFGGAELERYLLPVLPLVYIAMAAAWSTLAPPWRNVSIAVVAAGLLAGLFVNPPYPFPFENNLAMADFVELQQNAAQVLQSAYPSSTIYSAWPFTAALRNPAFGYVDRTVASAETGDLRYSTLAQLDPKHVNVLVLYSRTWEPTWGALRIPLVVDFLRRFYAYDRQMNSKEVEERFGLISVARFTQRGQWIEIFARAGQPKRSSDVRTE